MNAKTLLLLAVLFAGTFASAQSLTSEALPTPYNAAVNGGYSYLLSEMRPYYVMFNAKGQQVGFCTFGSLPYGYSCQEFFGQDLDSGKLIADGAGNILNTSTLTITSDPNSYKCSVLFSPVATCPYVVPSTNIWSSATSYGVGAVVIYPGTGGKTFQAAAGNTNAAPVLITNGSNPQVGNACQQGTYLGGGLTPHCTWVLLPNSNPGKNRSGSTTMSGTYSVQASGLGTLTVTPLGGSASQFQILVPPRTTGQQIQFAAKPTLGNESRGTGTAVLQ